MSEQLGNFENNHERHEAETTHEVAKAPEAKHEQVDHQAEARAKKHEVEQARKEIEKAHETANSEPAQAGTRAVHVPLHKLEPIVQTVAQTWSSIRQNLSPTQKTFSKVIHNPVVSSVSEFTAKTLARPYAILAGGVVAVAGSAVYLYYTRHLGYTYNFFVPIMLFIGGLVAGIIVEMLYKLFAKPHKR